MINLTFTVSICAWFLKCQFGSLLQTISNQTWFFFKFELDFYCLCSLQKSILKSNWFFNFLNLIFRNWKKIEWHSIFQKSSGDRQGDWIKYLTYITLVPQLVPLWSNWHPLPEIPSEFKICFVSPRDPIFGGSTPLISAASLKACNLNQYSNLPEKNLGCFHSEMSKRCLLEMGQKPNLCIKITFLV